jgi:hypothetical protein
MNVDCLMAVRPPYAQEVRMVELKGCPETMLPELLSTFRPLTPKSR